MKEFIKQAGSISPFDNRLFNFVFENIGFMTESFTIMQNQKNTSKNDLPVIAVVSITQNRCAPLLVLLEQLRQIDYPKELLDIYLVDSASKDDTVEKVRQCFPEVKLSSCDKNTGIATGFNMCIKKALDAERDYKYLWLLDSDAEIETATLLPLVETLEDNPDVAVAGSSVYEPQIRDQLITAGLNINWDKANISFHRPDPDKIDGLFDVSLIPACSMLTRTQLYYDMGLWDERLWLYWGDTEWCTRAKANGHRVCCRGRSRVWHRNWADIKPNFTFPFALHDRIRSALLFNSCYKQNGSIKGVRNLILSGYIKAAFESLTLRPNFSRAYTEGVDDFLKADFSKKDFSRWHDELDLKDLEQTCADMKSTLSVKPKIILNQISDKPTTEKIKEIFESSFENIEWLEIEAHNMDNTTAGERIKEYAVFHLSRFLLGLVTFFNKKDLIISPIELGCLYNISSAKYTLLIDNSGQCCLRKNRILRSIAAFIRLILKSITTLFKLRYILKSNNYKRYSLTEK